MSYSSNKVTPLRSRKRGVSTNKKSALNNNQKNSKFSPATKLVSLREKRKKIPHWLQSFRLLENSSFLIALMLICTTMGLYGWTVLTQQTWSKQYRNLETLQRQERDFLATGESLKQQLAEKAQDSNNNLIPATPEQTLFLDSSPPKTFFSSQKQAENSLVKNNNLPPIKRPLGY